MRRTFTAEEKASVFELWKNGTGFSEIANILGSKPGTIFTMLRDTGGIKPHDRNRAVANQRMTGSNARWKWTTDYNRRSIAETAMYRVKQLFGGSLTLRDYDGQVAEAMALVRALNKMTKAGMPESVRIA